jgi:glycosyltransferase involved in cell wall biosynthesis
VDLIIFNSEAGLLNHAAMGMRAPRMQVIPNGFDVARFQPDASLGAAQRKAWGVPPEVPLVGIVGRLDPVKDHPTFLRAAARLGQAWPEARFLCVGGGSGPYVESLRAQALALGIAHRVLWPGACAGMPGVYNALSVLVLASTDEGFPNVLGEAMACGIPCVTTRVGDAAALVGDLGAVVAPGDDLAMAEATARFLDEPLQERQARAGAGRNRILSSFSTAALARNTEHLLGSLLHEGA